MKKYEQLKRLYRTMNEYMEPYDFSDQMVSALTADFDRLFELSWKTLKEYMQNELMIPDAKTGSPREIIKSNGFIFSGTEMMIRTIIKIRLLFYIRPGLRKNIWM